MKITNIDWYVNREDILEAKDNLSVDEILKIIKAKDMNQQKWNSLTSDEQDEIVLWELHHCPAKVNELMKLPDEVVLPDEFSEYDTDEIAEHLSDQFGWFVNSFVIEYESK